jgi:hypothetical protein
MIVLDRKQGEQSQLVETQRTHASVLSNFSAGNLLPLGAST